MGHGAVKGPGLLQHQLDVEAALPPHFDQAGLLQNADMVGDGGAGEVGPLRDGLVPGAAAVRDMHHLQNEVLTGLAPQGRQELLAAAELLGELVDLLGGNGHGYPPSLIGFNHYTAKRRKIHIGKENRDHKREEPEGGVPSGSRFAAKITIINRRLFQSTLPMWGATLLWVR